MLPFCACNSVRIAQNIQNEVLLERYIFADVVAYQFINLKWKLNGSREECINIIPYGSYTTLAVRKGLKELCHEIYSNSGNRHQRESNI